MMKRVSILAFILFTIILIGCSNSKIKLIKDKNGELAIQFNKNENDTTEDKTESNDNEKTVTESSTDENMENGWENSEYEYDVKGVGTWAMEHTGDGELLSNIAIMIYLPQDEKDGVLTVTDYTSDERSIYTFKDDLVVKEIDLSNLKWDDYRLAYELTADEIARLSKYNKVTVSVNKLNGSSYMGCVNLNGDWIIQPNYSTLLYNYKTNGYIIARKDGELCILNPNGEIVNDSIDYAFYLDEYVISSNDVFSINQDKMSNVNRDTVSLLKEQMWETINVGYYGDRDFGDYKFGDYYRFIRYSEYTDECTVYSLDKYFNILDMRDVEIYQGTYVHNMDYYSLINDDGRIVMPSEKGYTALARRYGIYMDGLVPEFEKAADYNWGTTTIDGETCEAMYNGKKVNGTLLWKNGNYITITDEYLNNLVSLDERIFDEKDNFAKAENSRYVLVQKKIIDKETFLNIGEENAVLDFEEFDVESKDEFAERLLNNIGLTIGDENDIGGQFDVVYSDNVEVEMN